VEKKKPVIRCDSEKNAVWLRRLSTNGGLPWGDLKEKAIIRFAHSWSFLFAPNLRQAWVCFKQKTRSAIRRTRLFLLSG
jgi:hypothetical protein